jgi:cystathionine beta-lyase/cystathionine gamma-synthase
LIARSANLVRFANAMLPRSTATWAKDDTAFVHAGVAPDANTGAILTPVYISTTFAADSVEEYCKLDHVYSRMSNPTVSTLEAKVAELEGGKGAVCVGSGMAAVASVFSTFLNAGDHCVVSYNLSSDVDLLVKSLGQKYNIEFSAVDFEDLDNIRQAIKPNTKMIYSESPSNPTLMLTDIEAISEIATGADCMHVVDATFSSPMLCNPLEWGADLAVMSLAKFYDGHNMGMGGAVVAKAQRHLDSLHQHKRLYGNIMLPEAAFRILQAMKTLPLRLRQQSETADTIAKFLAGHPKVSKVVYPGTSHPQKALADKYHKHGIHGCLLTFEVEGGEPAAHKLVDSIGRPWSLSWSLGATESIMTAPHPQQNTYCRMHGLPIEPQQPGITPGFVRLSCGIEDCEDLLAALSKGLDAT